MADHERLVRPRRPWHYALLHRQPARTLYQAWERILEHGDGRLHVHLLLNRASPWADVDSHLPYQGQVDVKAKEDIEELSVRIPAWADVGAVEAAVGDVRRQVAWNGRYAKLGPVPAGVTATVRFPIFERSEHVRVEKLYGLVLVATTSSTSTPRGSTSRSTSGTTTAQTRRGGARLNVS